MLALGHANKQNFHNTHMLFLNIRIKRTQDTRPNLMDRASFDIWPGELPFLTVARTSSLSLTVRHLAPYTAAKRVEPELRMTCPNTCTEANAQAVKNPPGIVRDYIPRLYAQLGLPEEISSTEYPAFAIARAQSCEPSSPRKTRTSSCRSILDATPYAVISRPIYRHA